MATEALQGGPYPAGTAAANVPTDLQAVVVWAAPKLVQTYASAAARTSAFSTAGVSPALGMLGCRTDAPGINKFEYYNSTAGQWRVHGAYQDTQVLSGVTASVTFSNVPTYLKTLRVSVTGRGDAGATNIQVQLRVGGDSAAVYGQQFHYVISGGATGGQTAGAANQTSGHVGYLPAANIAAGRFGGFTVDITGWDSPAGHTTGCQWTMRGGYIAGATYLSMTGGVGEYVGTSALTSVSLLPAAGNFVAGSEFQLLGFE